VAVTIPKNSALLCRVRCSHRNCLEPGITARVVRSWVSVPCSIRYRLLRQWQIMHEYTGNSIFSRVYVIMAVTRDFGITILLTDYGIIHDSPKNELSGGLSISYIITKHEQPRRHPQFWALAAFLQLFRRPPISFSETLSPTPNPKVIETGVLRYDAKG
jgi:hypothetical protein